MKATRITRRESIKRIALAYAGVLAAPMINRGRFRLFANSSVEYSARAIDLIGRSTVIDMLSVLTLDFNKEAKWLQNPESFQAADLKRLRILQPFCFFVEVERQHAEHVDHCRPANQIDCSRGVLDRRVRK